MFERYNERARRAIYFARWWALNRPSKVIDTRDLILGIVHDPDVADGPYRGLSARREAMIAMFADGIVPVPKPRAKDIPLTDHSKRAMSYAAMEADLDKRASIDPFHLFRGVLREGDETARKLIAAGETIEALREESRKEFPRVVDRGGWGGVPWRFSLTVSAGTRWAIAVAVLLFAGALLYLHSQN